MSNAFVDLLQSFQILTKEDIQTILRFVKPRSVAKGIYFSSEGKVCEEVAFVGSGVFRSYYVAANGEQITYCFTFPGQFLTAYSSYITGTGTLENIQSLTPAELLILPKNEIEHLASRSHTMVAFLKTVAEYQYIELERRVFQLQRTSALARYSDLITHQPELVRNIPLGYLASYLGITQRHLSRIRRQMTEQ